MNDQDYAIIVGIKYTGLDRLQATLHDATRFYQWLVKPDGGAVPCCQARLIVSPESEPSNLTDARPVQTQIDQVLREWGALLGERIGRRLYFYFSGHGFGGPGFNDVGMLMADASAENFNSNLGLEGYRQLFQDVKLFDEIFFVLDCCRSPAAFKHGVQLRAPTITLTKVEGVPPPVVDEFVLAAPNGFDSYEITDPATNERFGLLTRVLLDALKSKAAADAEGRFTTGSLSSYVSAEAPKLASWVKSKQITQLPRFLSMATRELIFAKLAPAQLETPAPVRIVAQPNIGGELVVFDGTTDEIDRRPAHQITDDQPEWRVPLLRTKRYSVRHVVSAEDTANGVLTHPDGVIVWPTVEADNHEYVFPQPEQS